MDAFVLRKADANSLHAAKKRKPNAKVAAPSRHEIPKSLLKEAKDESDQDNDEMMTIAMSSSQHSNSSQVFDHDSPAPQQEKWLSAQSKGKSNTTSTRENPFFLDKAALQSVQQPRPIRQNYNLCNMPPAFVPYTDALTDWFSVALADKRPGIEIEGKVGRFASGRFESMVEPVLFNEQLSQCQRSLAGGIFEKSERETTITFLFGNGVRGTQYSDQRSEFVRKRRISNYDVSFNNKNDTSPLAVRLSYNIESPCDPPCDKVQWVRLRRRESFTYKGTWRFDFTYVRQGSTKAEAQKSELQHEIEVEYIGHCDSTLERQKENLKEAARYLVVSLLLKMHDVAGYKGTPQALRILQHVVKEKTP